MVEPEHEMRDRLARTWKALTARLTSYDFPPHLIFETLAEVATDGMLEKCGSSATAQMLRLRADAIEAQEADHVQGLLTGEDDAAAAPLAPLLAVSGFDPSHAHAADRSAALDLIGH